MWAAVITIDRSRTSLGESSISLLFPQSVILNNEHAEYRATLGNHKLCWSLNLLCLDLSLPTPVPLHSSTGKFMFIKTLRQMGSGGLHL